MVTTLATKSGITTNTLTINSQCNGISSKRGAREVSTTIRETPYWIILVILQPNFRRALPESTKSIVKRKEKAISVFTCWAADPGIENIADSAETILFILKLSLLGYNGNRNIDITSGKDGRLHHTYTG